MSTVTVNIPTQVSNHANLAAFPVTGALKTIYIAEDTNLEYRWTGSAYQVLGNSVTVNVNNIGSAINGAASATPNDTDLVMSVESSVAKKNTWTQVKAFLKTYFDTIYTTTSAVATQISTAISGKLDANAPITGATKTKITYDSKGLVTAGTDATTADIADSLNKRYQTDAQQLYNDATSSIQTQLNRLPFFIVGHSSLSPLDSTTYAIGVFFSLPMQSTTGGGASTWRFPYSKTITKIVVITRYAVAGSNVASPIVLRNQTTTTDYTIGNLDYSLVSFVGAAGFVQEFTVSIAVNDTDFYWLKEVTPAWGTNPTNVSKTIYFY